MPNTKVGSISLCCFMKYWQSDIFLNLRRHKSFRGNQISLVWLPNYDFSLRISSQKTVNTLFLPCALILSIFSFPEDHLSSFGDCLSQLSYPGWQPVCADLLETGCPNRCQALCILFTLTPLSFLPCFHLVLFTNSFWLLIHIPLWVDFLWRSFPWTCRCITMTLGLCFVSMMW